MINIRREAPKDIEAIYEVNKRAFGGTAEADLVNALRSRVKNLISLVAVDEGKVVGHILFSPMTVEGAPVKHSFAGLAPVAVLPEYQKKGIGGQLVRAGLEKCRKAGYSAVAVLGHPQYYPHFGFTPAEAYDIRCEFDVPRGVFMLFELSPGTLAAVRGCRLLYRPEFKEL